MFEVPDVPENCSLSEMLQETDAEANSGEFLTIGSLAKLCGVTVRTLRYYEEMDLIGPVMRTTGKYRLYNRHSLKRVKAILALQDLNYSLESIVETLGPYSKSRTYSREEQVTATRRSLHLQQEQIEHKLRQIHEMQQEINRRLTVLDNVCGECSKTRPEDKCPEVCDYLNVHD